MANFVGTLIGLFLILAGFAGVIGGILLIIAGEWSLFFYLIFAGSIAPFVMAFVMMPSMILALPSVSLFEKGHLFLSGVFAWLGSLYLGAVFAGWSAYIFIYVMNATSSFWGGVFASFGTAISPIAFMSSKEPIGNDLDIIKNTLVMLTAQISLLAMVILGVINGGTIYDIGFFYFGAYAVLSALSITISGALFKK